MRNELKNTNWHTYGLSINDFDYTLRLITEIIDDRERVAQLNTKETRCALIKK